VRDNYPADRGSYNRRNPIVEKALPDCPTDPFCVRRMLKNERALQIPRTVEPGRQLEVSFQQRAGLLKYPKQALGGIITFF
jgi:hypothetical protein